MNVDTKVLLAIIDILNKFYILAIARNYTNVAMVLLHAGADFDLANGQGYTSIHLAAREGLLGLAQSLCAFGCVVDVTGKADCHSVHFLLISYLTGTVKNIIWLLR